MRSGSSSQIARVDIGNGLAYWTVLSGARLEVVEPVDAYLRHLRFGRSRAESTTKTYAGHLRRLHEWRSTRGIGWDDAARDLAGYVVHLRSTPRGSPGRGQGVTPSDAAIAPALAAIHGFYMFAIDTGQVDAEITRNLFTVLPAPVATRHGRVVAVAPRIRVDARTSYPNRPPAAATVTEVAALLRTARTDRDRAIIGLLAGCGLRVGQLVCLQRDDLHLLPVGQWVDGCDYLHGPHVHLQRRDGHPKGAANKNRTTVVVPVPQPAAMLYGAWLHERRRIRAAASNHARDVLQALLGHASVASQDAYRNSTDARVLVGAAAISDRLFATT